MLVSCLCRFFYELRRCKENVDVWILERFLCSFDYIVFREITRGKSSYKLFLVLRYFFKLLGTNKIKQDLTTWLHILLPSDLAALVDYIRPQSALLDYHLHPITLSHTYTCSCSGSSPAAQAFSIHYHHHLSLSHSPSRPPPHCWIITCAHLLCELRCTPFCWMLFRWRLVCICFW